MKKEAQKCGQLKKLSKVNYHPMCENSPNLVTLVFCHGEQKEWSVLLGSRN
jgi:hypothetical protein